MPEIGTSGSMSGDGKRGVAEWPKLPRPSSTLPFRHMPRCTLMSAFGLQRKSWNISRRALIAGRVARLHHRRAQTRKRFTFSPCQREAAYQSAIMVWPTESR